MVMTAPPNTQYRQGNIECELMPLNSETTDAFMASINSHVNTDANLRQSASSYNALRASLEKSPFGASLLDIGDPLTDNHIFYFDSANKAKDQVDATLVDPPPKPKLIQQGEHSNNGEPKTRDFKHEQAKKKKDEKEKRGLLAYEQDPAYIGGDIDRVYKEWNIVDDKKSGASSKIKKRKGGGARKNKSVGTTVEIEAPVELDQDDETEVTAVGQEQTTVVAETVTIEAINILTPEAEILDDGAPAIENVVVVEATAPPSTTISDVPDTTTLVDTQTTAVVHEEEEAEQHCKQMLRDGWAQFLKKHHNSIAYYDVGKGLIAPKPILNGVGPHHKPSPHSSSAPAAASPNAHRNSSSKRARRRP